MLKFTLVLMIALAGCATSGVMNSLELGMTKSEVMEVMGDPVSKIISPNQAQYQAYRSVNLTIDFRFHI